MNTACSPAAPQTFSFRGGEGVRRPRTSTRLFTRNPRPNLIAFALAPLRDTQRALPTAGLSAPAHRRRTVWLTRSLPCGRHRSLADRLHPELKQDADRAPNDRAESVFAASTFGFATAVLSREQLELEFIAANGSRIYKVTREV